MITKYVYLKVDVVGYHIYHIFINLLAKLYVVIMPLKHFIVNPL